MAESLALEGLECQNDPRITQVNPKNQTSHGDLTPMTNIQPLGDRVVVQPQPAEEKTASGLFIPDTAKEKPQRGEVVSVGPGRVEDGSKIDMTVSPGDTVLYGKYSGTEISINNEDLLIMRESDILGIITD